MTNDSRCTCPWTDPSTWTYYGDATEPGSQREFDPYCPEHGLLQPPHPTKWTVHVQGPDDLHYYDDEAAAREAAMSVNDWWATQPKDAWMDRMGEAHDRSVMPCLDCEIGEPHACERAWWRQQLDHRAGRECADPECMCHEAAELARQAELLWPPSYLAAAVRGGS